MVALPRCLVSVALALVGSEGARVARKRVGLKLTAGVPRGNLSSLGEPETQVEQERVVASQNNSALRASLPIAISDCGGSDHIVSLVDYQPKRVSTGSTTVLHVTGTVSDEISGGNMNMSLFMTRFPWTKLGELKNVNFCNPLTIELSFMGIYGGKLEWGGIDCPVGTGEMTVDVKLTLANIPTRLMNVRAELDGTRSDGKPLFCSRSTISGR